MSPEILRLYRLPALLNGTGMALRDRDSILSLVLETSGGIDIVSVCELCILRSARRRWEYY